MSIWTIVVAAGGGERFGAPKQFVPLAGAPIIDRSVATARRASDGVVVALPAACAHDWKAPGADVHTVAGGATRSASVRAALAAVPPDAEIVVVHDAARPLASPVLFAAVIAAVRAGADGAVPGAAVTDTVKRVVDGVVTGTVARDELVVVQTPQAFRAATLRAAHETAHDNGRDATDDAALVESIGGHVVVVAAEPRNVKITTPADLELAAMLLDAP